MIDLLCFSGADEAMKDYWLRRHYSFTSMILMWVWAMGEAYQVWNLWFFFIWFGALEWSFRATRRYEKQAKKFEES